MKKLIVGLFAALTLAATVPMVASSRATADCVPNADPPTTAFANLAVFYGHTEGCYYAYQDYYWTLKVQYWTGSTWQNLGTLSGGPTHNSRYWSYADPPTVTVNCLAPNGTARAVRDQLYINTSGQGHTSNSGYKICKRQGGTEPVTP